MALAYDDHRTDIIGCLLAFLFALSCQFGRDPVRGRRVYPVCLFLFTDHAHHFVGHHCTTRFGDFP